MMRLNSLVLNSLLALTVSLSINTYAQDTRTTATSTSTSTSTKPGKNQEKRTQNLESPSSPDGTSDKPSLSSEDEYTDLFEGEDTFDLDQGELDVVVVTGSKMEEKLSDAVTQVEVITRAQIEDTPAENAADLLEEQHGIQVNRSFSGAGVRIQGFDNKHVLILIDGERQVGRIDGVIDLTRIPADLIEQIEIVKGPSSSLYGSDAMGGVINIITRRERSKEPRFALRGSYGSRSALDLNGDASA
jgi:outer membrane receptor protein involved in Fe transport